MDELDTELGELGVTAVLARRSKGVWHVDLTSHEPSFATGSASGSSMREAIKRALRELRARRTEKGDDQR